jgi:hypothetical protein
MIAADIKRYLIPFFKEADQGSGSNQGSIYLQATK